MKDSSGPRWRAPDGTPISCIEKLKVLEQNLAEFVAVAQDLVEDAALMGCDVDQVRRILKTALDDISTGFMS